MHKKYAHIVENVKKVVKHAKNNWKRKQSISVDVCWNNRILCNQYDDEDALISKFELEA